VRFAQKNKVQHWGTKGTSQRSFATIFFFSFFGLKNVETSKGNKSFFNLPLFWSASNDVWHNEHFGFVCHIIKLLQELFTLFSFSV
jgi:hypothetical protein